MQAVIPFQFQTYDLSVLTDDEGEPWWIAAEVCMILELANVSQAVSRLDADEKNTIISNDGTAGNPLVLIVNESGLYSLILGSRKKVAKDFKRWVTHDVLPQIRKTGQYAIEAYPSTPRERALFLLRQAQQFVAIEERQEAFEAQQRQVIQDLREIKAALPDPTTQLSVKAYANLVGVALRPGLGQRLGKRCAGLARAWARPVGSVSDETYGQVNTYDRDILARVFADECGISEPPTI